MLLMLGLIDMLEVVVEVALADLAVVKRWIKFIIVLELWVFYLKDRFFLGVLNALMKFELLKVDVLFIKFLIYIIRRYLFLR